MERSLSDDFNFEKELLYTPGRGRNTWSVYFWGKTECKEAVSFTCRLNINSLPFGFRYIKMYDTVSTLLFENDSFYFGRDFGPIKKKKQLLFDKLFFEGNLTKMQMEDDVLQLTTFASDVKVDITVDVNNRDGAICHLNNDDCYEHDGKSMDWMVASNMACECSAEFGNSNVRASGKVWLEKKFTEFPVGRMKKGNAETEKVIFIPENLDKQLVYVKKSNKLDNTEKIWLMEFGSDGEKKIWTGNSIKSDYIQTWTSQHTGQKYSLPIDVRLESPLCELTATPNYYDQEVFTKGTAKSTGEYLGVGQFNGVHQGSNVNGACFIEINTDRF